LREVEITAPITEAHAAEETLALPNLWTSGQRCWTLRVAG